MFLFMASEKLEKVLCYGFLQESIFWLTNKALVPSTHPDNSDNFWFLMQNEIPSYFISHEIGFTSFIEMKKKLKQSLRIASIDAACNFSWFISNECNFFLHLLFLLFLGVKTLFLPWFINQNHCTKNQHLKRIRA